MELRRAFRRLSFPGICVGPASEELLRSLSTVLGEATTEQQRTRKPSGSESISMMHEYYLSSSSKKQVFCGQFVACSLPEHLSAHLARQATHSKREHSSVDGQLRWLLGNCQPAPAIAKVVLVCIVKPLTVSHAAQERPGWACLLWLSDDLTARTLLLTNSIIGGNLMFFRHEYSDLGTLEL